MSLPYWEEMNTQQPCFSNAIIPSLYVWGFAVGHPAFHVTPCTLATPPTPPITATMTAPWQTQPNIHQESNFSVPSNNISASAQVHQDVHAFHCPAPTNWTQINAPRSPLLHLNSTSAYPFCRNNLSRTYVRSTPYWVPRWTQINVPCQPWHIPESQQYSTIIHPYMNSNMGQHLDLQMRDVPLTATTPGNTGCQQSSLKKRTRKTKCGVQAAYRQNKKSVSSTLEASEKELSNYIDILCKDPEFMSKVEEIINPKFLDAILSPDPNLDIDKLAKDLQLEDSFFEWTKGQPNI